MLREPEGLRAGEGPSKGLKISQERCEGVQSGSYGSEGWGKGFWRGPGKVQVRLFRGDQEEVFKGLGWPREAGCGL